MFEQIVCRYQRSLHLFVRHRLHDHELARDVMQFAFRQLYLSIPRFPASIARGQNRASRGIQINTDANVGMYE